MEEDFGPAFHQMLGMPWPCSELEHFHRIWADIGRNAFGQGALIRSLDLRGVQRRRRGAGAASWCAVRHLQPAKVIETGVARGVTSRVILEAMSLNGIGHLWSVDLPHPFRPELHKETAAAVPTACRDRWTYVRGSSRSRLPSLVSGLREIDMFVHDSLHTGRNMRFELNTVWPAMHGGDLALVDDVDNQFFRDFVREAGEPPSTVMRSADGTYMFGAIRKARPVDHGARTRYRCRPVAHRSPTGHSHGDRYRSARPDLRMTSLRFPRLPLSSHASASYGTESPAVTPDTDLTRGSADALVLDGIGRQALVTTRALGRLGLRVTTAESSDLCGPGSDCRPSPLVGRSAKTSFPAITSIPMATPKPCSISCALIQLVY